MKLAEYDGQVQTSGEMQRSSFAIANNRKAFEILSSGIYSDKIKAVIRELSTNAADAHVAAELQTPGYQPKPFIVHLPNAMEPFFSVQDFGTGMTDDEVYTLYTTYFASNRNNSNRFTGALGLGSKSPFAYTEQFTVVSTLDGKRRTYTCFIDGKGMPTVTPMLAEVTDDPNGVLVKLPVETKDFNEFHNKAADTLGWFKPLPEVVGWVDFKWKSTNYLLNNKVFGLPVEKRDRSHVIMGNVAYLLSSYDITGLPAHDANLIQWGVDIWVDIGDVEVAASREKLSYTKDTIKLLKAKMRKIGDILRDEAVKFLERAKTIWEARRMINDYKKGVMGGFLANTKLVWQGKPISSFVCLDKYSNPPATCELAYKGRVHKGANVPVLRKNPTNSVDADGTPIIVDDLVRGGIKRIAYHMLTSKVEKVYILSKARAMTDLKEPSHHQEEDDDDVKGAPPIEDSGLYETAFLSSDLVEAPKLPRTNSDGTRNSYTKLMLLDTNRSGSDRTVYWKNDKVIIDDGGVYVVMKRFGVIKGGQKDLSDNSRDHRYRCPSSCVEALNYMWLLGEELEVHGVRPADVARLDKAGNWITLRDHVTKFLSDNRNTMQPRVMSSLQFARVEATRGYLNLKRSEFSDESPFGKFLDAMRSAKNENDSADVKAYMDLTGWLGKDRDCDVKERDARELERLVEKMHQIYPLLALIAPTHIHNKTSNHLVEYITLLDNEHGTAQEVLDAEAVTA
jgi:hypothetical protein